MSRLVTQCPHCKTSFRISPAQLAVAHGAVRCGACLKVFVATQHLLGDDDTPAPTKPAAATQRTTPSPRPAVEPPPADLPPSGSVWMHDELDLDDLDLDNLDLDEELARLEQQESGTRPPTRTDTPATSRPRPDPTDERGAEALLEEAERPARREPTPPPIRFKPGAAEAGPRLSPTPLQNRTEPPPPRTRDVQRQSTPAAEHMPPTPPAARAPAQEDDEPSLGELDHLFEPDTTAADRRDAPLLDLADEPLQLHWQPPRRPWRRWLGWGALTVLALLAVLAQYIVHNFAELARQERYRPWLEQACPLLGCTLPSRVDIDQIKSSNLTVRSHPDFKGALIVDAILYNRAEFSQPFPLLELQFSDLNGQLLASRRFKPGEYLSGELAGQTQMPPQTPIHIALDILDPGERAVNYRLNFHSPD